jgi:hypothetical protein
MTRLRRRRPSKRTGLKGPIMAMALAIAESMGRLPSRVASLGRGELLVTRLHVDLHRVSTALCSG